MSSHNEPIIDMRQIKLGDYWGRNCARTDCRCCPSIYVHPDIKGIPLMRLIEEAREELRARREREARASGCVAWSGCLFLAAEQHVLAGCAPGEPK